MNILKNIVKEQGIVDIIESNIDDIEVYLNYKKVIEEINDIEYDCWEFDKEISYSTTILNKNIKIKRSLDTTLYCDWGDIEPGFLNVQEIIDVTRSISTGDDLWKVTKEANFEQYYVFNEYRKIVVHQYNNN